MAKHTIETRKEFRYGMRGPEFRVMCDCGWVDKAQDEQQAKITAGKHLADVVEQIRPQKTLDLGDQHA